MLSIVGSLLALSLGAGLLGSLSGLGGGVFIVPALVIVGGLPMQVAIGASLISVVATSAGASVAFVRDGFTNLKVAMVLECATVTGAVSGALLAGRIPSFVLEGLFAVMMLLSAYLSLHKHDDESVVNGDPLARRLGLGGDLRRADGSVVHYEVVRLPLGGSLMLAAGMLSGMLGIGAGAVKVVAMDACMRLPLKVSTATSNFMIGVTAGAGALVFLARGEIPTVVAGPVAIGVSSGALLGSRLLSRVEAHRLRVGFAVILLLIAVEMGWRALSGL